MDGLNKRIFRTRHVTLAGSARLYWFPSSSSSSPFSPPFSISQLPPPFSFLSLSLFYFKEKERVVFFLYFPSIRIYPPPWRVPPFFFFSTDSFPSLFSFSSSSYSSSYIFKKGNKTKKNKQKNLLVSALVVLDLALHTLNQPVVVLLFAFFFSLDVQYTQNGNASTVMGLWRLDWAI